MECAQLPAATVIFFFCICFSLYDCNENRERYVVENLDVMVLELSRVMAARLECHVQLYDDQSQNNLHVQARRRRRTKQ
jgi:hypothetical protein